MKLLKIFLLACIVMITSIYGLEGSQSNILWHNSTTGAVKMMPIVGMTPEESINVVPSSNTNLVPRGIGDFTNNGMVDILFHNQNSGNLRIWKMYGTVKVDNILVLGSSNTNLQIAGVGDFDQDGDNDIATFNTNSGALRIWVMDGTVRVDNVLVLTGANTNLVPSGVGDMDSDGIPDLVLRNNNSGVVRIWTMNSDFSRKGNNYVTGSSNTNLELRGVVDINGDGNNDILNYNTNTGKLRAWLMDGHLAITENTEITQERDLEWSVRDGIVQVNPEDKGFTVNYTYGDMTNSEAYFNTLNASLAKSTSALVQAVYSINSFLHTDPSVTDLDTFKERKVQVDKALAVLDKYTKETESVANIAIARKADLSAKLFSSTAIFATVPSAEEISAVINSANAGQPIATLMQQYNIGAKEAKKILDNAMSELVDKYEAEASWWDLATRAADLVKNASGLTFGLGAAVIAAGPAATGLTVKAAVVLAVTSADALIKTGVSGAELILGEDVDLEGTTLGAVTEVTEVISKVNAVKSLLSKPETLVDQAGNIVFVGEGTEWLINKTAEFTESSVKVSGEASELMDALKDKNYTAQLPGEYHSLEDDSKIIVLEVPNKIKTVLEVLPTADKVEDVEKITLNCPADQKVDGGVCVDKTCWFDDYNCPQCAETEELNFNMDGSGYCEETSPHWKLVKTVRSGDDYKFDDVLITLDGDTCDMREWYILEGETIRYEFYHKGVGCSFHIDITGDIEFTAPPSIVRPGAAVPLNFSGYIGGYKSAMADGIAFAFRKDGGFSPHLNVIALTIENCDDVREVTAGGFTFLGWQCAYYKEELKTYSFPESGNEFFIELRGNRGVGIQWHYEFVDR